MKYKALFINILLCFILFLAVILATGMGFLHISAPDVIKIILAKILPISQSTLNEVHPFVVLEVRLPRILTAILVGGGLALAGCVFQAILLNPLADPYTLGISSGAAFGAAIALLAGIAGTLLPQWFTVPFCAFIGAVATLFGVFALSSGDKNFSSNTLILSGVILSAILSAGIGFIKYLADEEVSIIVFWLMGSLVGRSWKEVFLLLALIFPASLLLYYYAKDLNIMSLGKKASDALGVETYKTRKILLIAASLITAACVSVSGIIGFIGLIVPHLLRLVLGPDNRVLLPGCFLGGALLLLVADTITRAYLPTEIPIGVLTSLIGGPFFCYIFRKKQLGVLS